MNAQTITSPKGEKLVVIPEKEYRALLAAAEDAKDVRAVRRFEQALAAGEEELVPAAVVDRILAGENRIRVWREHRGLAVKDLARAAGIAAAYLSQVETGKRDGTIETYRKIAGALGLTLDEIAG
jgi:DNA-binding XRE family transcriptional regulator